MKTIYRGFAQRAVERIIYIGNVATDPSALVATIKKASTGEVLVTTAEGTFSELSVIANKVATGRYFVEVTPDSDEAIGVWVCYLRATVDGETWELGPDVFEIRAEDEIPDTADNYVSLDSIASWAPDVLDLYRNPTELLRIGEKCSRILDSELDNRFSVPLRKRPDLGSYDEIVVKIATLLTIARALKAKGYRDLGEYFEGEYRGFLDDLNAGKYRLWEETTRTEIGFSKPRPSTSNQTENIEIEIDPASPFIDSFHRLFVIEIDGAGDIYEDGSGATFKASNDGGKSWEATELPALDSWTYPSSCYGLGVRFFRRGSSGNLAVGDKWEIEAWPLSTEPAGSTRQVIQGKVIL